MHLLELTGNSEFNFKEPFIYRAACLMHNSNLTPLSDQGLKRNSYFSRLKIDCTQLWFQYQSDLRFEKNEGDFSEIISFKDKKRQDIFIFPIEKRRYLAH